MAGHRFILKNTRQTNKIIRCHFLVPVSHTEMPVGYARKTVLGLGSLGIRLGKTEMHVWYARKTAMGCGSLGIILGKHVHPENSGKGCFFR